MGKRCILNIVHRGRHCQCLARVLFALTSSCQRLLLSPTCHSVSLSLIYLGAHTSPGSQKRGIDVLEAAHKLVEAQLPCISVGVTRMSRQWD